MEEVERFISHIGKTIYRDDDGCTCKGCKDILKNGLLVHDINHARYLYDIQNDYACEGILLNYRDTKGKLKN